MQKRFMIMASLILILFAGPVSAEEQLIKIGVLNFPPFYEVEDGKEPAGFMLDYLKAALDKAGYKYEAKGYPPKRLYQNLADSTSDVFLGIKGNPAYEGKVLYSKSKVTDIDLQIYTRPDTEPLKSKEEFIGKKIIVIRGYGYGGLITFLQDPANKIEMDETADHEIAFKKLQAKRADYVLDYRRPSTKALQKVNIPDIKHHQISLIDIVLIVSMKTPNAQQVVDNVEKAFVDLKAEGKLADL